MNGHEPKFKRHKTAWTDRSLLITNSNNCMGADVVFETDMKNYYRDQHTESLRNTNSLLENSSNSYQKAKPN
jgi:hypothetical protein